MFRAVVLTGLAAAVLEMVLALVSNERRGLWNGWFEDSIYTWGHAVRPNRQGLREREVSVPKPPGVFRVLVLGDESAWGPGLAVEERFTALVEQRLRKAFPGRPIEVVNAALPGADWPTIRDALRFWCGNPVHPDLVVAAAGVGVLRLDSNDNRPVHAAWARRHPFIGLAIPRALVFLRMPMSARAWKAAVARMAEAAGAAPSLREELDRRWASDGPAWQADVAALRDIRAFCDAGRLPPPVFLSLDTVAPGARDAFSRRAAGWLVQLDRAAAEAGFIIPGGAEAAGLAAVRPDAWAIHPLNGIHPRHFQEAWARRLAESIERVLDPARGGSP